MKAVVTGAAGFVGSHISERLLSLGWQVIGIDCFTPYYAKAFKERNGAVLLPHPAFRLIEADLVGLDWPPILAGVDAVFHQAAQAGVRASWGATFGEYLHHNLLATQQLLEALRHSPGNPRMVFASSSSVYGDAEALPTPETVALLPVSPYGVTKAAAERLGFVYHQTYGVAFTALRYFTVYGPRQRPDMAFHRFMKALRRGEPIDVYGDGQQTRDFTYVADVIDANLAVLDRPEAIGEAFNIGGGSRVSLTDVLHAIETISGHRFDRRLQPEQAGDARHTGADITKAQRVLGYGPHVSLVDGLTAMWAWSEVLQS